MSSRKYDVPEVLSERIDEYFNEVDSKNSSIKKNTEITPPSIAGLCLHLKISKDTFYNYAKLSHLSDPIKKAQLKIEQWYVKHSMNRCIDNTTTIFVLKNMGWSDKQEIKQESVNKNIDINSVSEAVENMSDNEIANLLDKAKKGEKIDL